MATNVVLVGVLVVIRFSIPYSVGCCVISCQFFVKSELLLDFTYSGCKGLEKIGWHFLRTQ